MTTTADLAAGVKAEVDWFQLRCSREGCTYKRSFPNVREARTVYAAHWQEAHPAGHITVRTIIAEVSAAYNAASAAPESPSRTPPPSSKVSSNGQIEAAPTFNIDAFLAKTAAVLELDPDLIDPSPYQPRSEASLEAGLQDLVDGIRANGQQVPIAVRPKGDRYELLYGERRLRAIKTIGGGLQVKAIVQVAGELDAIKAAFEENGRRKDLTPLEVARAVDRLLSSDAGLTQVQVAGILGIAQPTVSNMRRQLHAMPKKVLELVDSGKVAWSALRPMLGFASDHGDHSSLVTQIVSQAANRPRGDVVSEDEVLSALRSWLNGYTAVAKDTKWDPLDEAAQRMRYSHMKVDKADYEKAAPGRLHDLGKDLGVWACDHDAYLKLTQGAPGTPAEQAARAIATLVKETIEDLPEGTPAPKHNTVKANLGAPIELSDVQRSWKKIPKSPEQTSVYELPDKREAATLGHLKHRMDNPAECATCPHGGHAVGLTKNYSDTVDAIELCTNFTCLAAKLTVFHDRELAVKRKAKAVVDAAAARAVVRIREELESPRPRPLIEFLVAVLIDVHDGYFGEDGLEERLHKLGLVDEESPAFPDIRKRQAALGKLSYEDLVEILGEIIVLQANPRYGAGTGLLSMLVDIPSESREVAAS